MGRGPRARRRRAQSCELVDGQFVPLRETHGTLKRSNVFTRTLDVVQSVEPGGVLAIIVQVVVVVVFIVRIMSVGESAAAPASTWNRIAIQQRGHSFVTAAARTGAALTGER